LFTAYLLFYQRLDSIYPPLVSTLLTADAMVFAHRFELVPMQDICCKETEFVRRAAAMLPRLMWFLGAGASRAAGMPTATDIIWDLKRRYYCLHENQDLQAHNVNNQIIRAKIQDYMASRGFPPLGSPDEYSAGNAGAV